MKRRDVLRSMALTPLVGRLAISSPDPKPNAATRYREAFAKLPAQSKAYDALLENVATAPLDQAAKSLVDRSAPALDLLRLGASISNCDWGDQWTAGFDNGFNLIPAARRLPKIAALSARFAVDNGHDPEGVEIVIAGLAFARHFAQGGVLIAQLLGFAIEHGVIDAAAAALPHIESASVRSLATRLTTLPTLVSLRDTVLAERAFFLGYVVPNEKLKPGDAKIKQYLALSDRIEKACDDPKAMTSLRVASKLDADEISFLENLDGLRLSAIPNIGVKRALFRAAIEVVKDGPSAIGRVLDPFDNAPFELRTWATGFELTSRFAPEKKPRVSLLAGTR